MSITAMVYIVASLSLKNWYEKERSKFLPGFIMNIEKYGYPKVREVKGNGQMVRPIQVNFRACSR